MYKLKILQIWEGLKSRQFVEWQHIPEFLMCAWALTRLMCSVCPSSKSGLSSVSSGAARRDRTHHQLWEQVNEVLRGENYWGVQGNHKAGPQSQVQIGRQLLLTHTHMKSSGKNLEQQKSSTELRQVWQSPQSSPCWSRAGCKRGLRAWSGEEGRWWRRCCQRSPPPPPLAASSKAGSLLRTTRLWTPSRHDTSSDEECISFSLKNM